jgi:integrase
MAVFKRKGSKYYQYKFEVAGVTYRGSTRVANKPQAKAIEGAIRLEVVEGKHGIKRKRPTPAFKAAMASFLEHVRQHRSTGTLKRYTCASVPLLAEFGGKNVDEVTADAIGKYKTARLKKKLEPATINLELAAFKAMISFLIENKDIDVDPAGKVKRLPVSNERDRTFSADEERLYLAAARQPLHDIAVLMLDCGCRPSELYQLRRENVDLDAETIFIPKGKSKSARRTLPLTRRAVETLKARLGEGSGDWVFPDSRDSSKPMTDASYQHECAMEASGIPPARLYDCRHTFATRFAEATGDLVALVALMGHQDLSQVLRYAHPADRHKAEGIRKMEEYQQARQIEETMASDLIQ